MITKGIILAGGTGSRLFPLTKTVNKHLLPVFDKPMIYYPLSTLMLAGIRDVALITSQDFLASFENLLGDGSDFGINISYYQQNHPSGIPEAFILCEEFIQSDRVALILGDNIFFGHGLGDFLKKVSADGNPSNIFAYHVEDPSRFGVVELSDSGDVLSIEEKPNVPKSNLAITGLYFFDNLCVDRAKSLTPSKRNETEITDLINFYFEQNDLHTAVLGRGYAWLDTGTPDALMNASHFIYTLESRQGLKIACLEEIAFQNRWIGKLDIEKAAEKYRHSSYGSYIKNLI